MPEIDDKYLAGTDSDLELELESDLDLDLELESELDLDLSWLESTEAHLDDYTPFYKKDVTRLTIARIYINVEGAVNRVSSSIETLDAPNTLTVRHMCAIIGTDRVWKKYMYIVNVDEDSVDDMGGDDNVFHDLTNAVQDVVIERTIEHFHDVNTLFILIKDTLPETAPAEIGDATSILEIELGSATPRSRKNRRHKTVSFGLPNTKTKTKTNTKTRRIRIV